MPNEIEHYDEDEQLQKGTWVESESDHMNWNEKMRSCQTWVGLTIEGSKSIDRQKLDLF